MRAVFTGLIRAMRPKQWVKQVLVLAAPFAAGQAFNTEIWPHVALAVLSFCLIASGAYLANDASDVEADRLHPKKKNRPIAAGVVPLPVAWVAAVVSTMAGLAVAALVSWNFVAVAAAYACLTLAYTFILKHIATVELVALASGFILRAVAGAVASDVRISVWFFVCVSAGAMLIACGKREAELAHASTRKVLSEYTKSFLVSVRTASMAVALGAYGSWAFDAAETGVAAQCSLAPFALALFRYAQISDKGDGGAPEDALLKDPVLLISGLVWAALMAWTYYG